MMKKPLNISVKIDNLSLKVNGNCIIQNLCAEILQGDMCLILGRNGSGKSTLMRAIVGLHPISAGNIEINKSEIAYMSQDISFDKSFPLRVIDLLRMGLYSKISTFESIQKYDEQINKVAKKIGMENDLNSHLRDISGGQLQRVFFGRMMVQNANLILLDEPFANLDILVIKDMIDLLNQWKSIGKTIIIITHDTIDQIQQTVDKTITLDKLEFTSSTKAPSINSTKNLKS
jgi:zinc/manganese transport system ATP-binding protein